MGFEIYRSPLWLVQVRGVATLVKIALVAGTAAWGKMQVEIFTLAIGIGAVTAHMPGRWRYHSLLHGRVAGPRGKG